MTVELRPIEVNERYVRETIGRYNLDLKLPSEVRPIERLIDRPKNTTASPMQRSAIAQSRIGNGTGYEELLAREWTKPIASMVVRGQAPVEFATVPGSTEIGYDIRGNEAILVAQRVVEVHLGNGYRKLDPIVTREEIGSEVTPRVFRPGWKSDAGRFICLQY
jgi:hypothetical protein